MQKLIEVKNLSCGYDKRNPVIKNLSFSLYRNEIVGLVGPNASGKTTFIKTILGIIKPLSGEVIKFNKKIKFGYIPQIFTINEEYPFSVYDILSFAYVNNFSFKLKEEQKRRIEEIIKKFAIDEFKFSIYKTLSGGLKQQVLICRSLLREPDILILDEPTNDLDIYNTTVVLKFVKKIKQEKNFTVIIATHALE
ncbi:MAG: ABC transporter ATP-binding protein, partial [Endomicrobia bacterium]|nr:ABC transporter ATP-binding protein [Endomicrobiia bacterium]